MVKVPTYKLELHRRGDTWAGLRVRVTPNPVIDWTGIQVEADWRARPARGSELGARWSTSGDRPVISTSLEGATLVVDFAPHVPELIYGTWYTDLQFLWPGQVDVTGSPLTHTWCNLIWPIYDDRTE